jgi:hypothetical protein
MKYNVGDVVITSRGLGIIENILELRDFGNVYETYIVGEGKRIPLFYMDIKEVI